MKLFLKTPTDRKFFAEYDSAYECCEAMNAYLQEKQYSPPYWRVIQLKTELRIDFGSYVDFFSVEGIDFTQFVTGYREFYKKWDKERKKNGN